MAKESLIVKIAINSVAETGKLMVAGLLEEIKAQENENQEETYEDLIKAGNAFFRMLARAAARTKTRTDDKIVAVFLEPLENAAEADGIEI